jgi:hypothetical protein
MHGAVRQLPLSPPRTSLLMRMAGPRARTPTHGVRVPMRMADRVQEMVLVMDRDLHRQVLAGTAEARAG